MKGISRVSDVKKLETTWEHDETCRKFSFKEPPFGPNLLPYPNVQNSAMTAESLNYRLLVVTSRLSALATQPHVFVFSPLLLLYSATS